MAAPLSIGGCGPSLALSMAVQGHHPSLPSSPLRHPEQSDGSPREAQPFAERHSDHFLIPLRPSRVYPCTTTTPAHRQRTGPLAYDGTTPTRNSGAAAVAHHRDAPTSQLSSAPGSAPDGPHGSTPLPGPYQSCPSDAVLVSVALHDPLASTSATSPLSIATATARHPIRTSRSTSPPRSLPAPSKRSQSSRSGNRTRPATALAAPSAPGCSRSPTTR